MASTRRERPKTSDRRMNPYSMRKKAGPVRAITIQRCLGVSPRLAFYMSNVGADLANLDEEIQG